MQSRKFATERTCSSGFSSPSTIFEEEDYNYGHGGLLAERVGFCGNQYYRPANIASKLTKLDGSSPHKHSGRRGSQDSPLNRSSAKRGRRRHTTVESPGQALPLQLKPFRAVMQTDKPRKEAVSGDERKAKNFLKKLQKEIPHLVYIRSDLTCRSLLAPDPQHQVLNYFDWELARTRRMQKKDGIAQAKYTNGNNDDYVELNFENSLDLSFRNSSLSNPIIAAWNVATHPRVYYLELGVPPNTKIVASTDTKFTRGLGAADVGGQVGSGIAAGETPVVCLAERSAYCPPFAFSFFVTFPDNDSPKEKLVSVSFRIINALPPFQEFGVWVRSKQHPEWRLGGKGIVRDNDQDWIRIEKSVRHRGAGLKTMEFTWEQKLEEDPQDVEFTLTPYMSLRQLKSQIPFSSKVQLGTLARGICRPHSHYLLLSSRPSSSLSSIRSQTLLVLNFLSPSFSPSLFSMLPGLVETFHSTGALSMYLRHNITTLVLLPGVLNFEREKEAAERLLRKLSERNRIAAVVNVLPSWIPNSGVFLEFSATDPIVQPPTKRPSIAWVEEPSEGRTGRRRAPDREGLFRELVLFFRECCNHFEEGRCKLIERPNSSSEQGDSSRLDEKVMSGISSLVCDARIPLLSSQTRRNIDPEDTNLIGRSLIKGFVMLIASRAAQLAFHATNAINNKDLAIESQRGLLKKPREQDQLDASILSELLAFENDCKESRLRFTGDLQEVKLINIKNALADVKSRNESMDKKSVDSKSLSSKRGSLHYSKDQNRGEKFKPPRRGGKIVLYGASDSDSDSSESQARAGSLDKPKKDGVISIFKTALHQLRNMASYQYSLQISKGGYHNPAAIKSDSPIRASSEKDLRDQKKLKSVKRGSLELKITHDIDLNQLKLQNQDKENISNAHNTQANNLQLKSLFNQISIAPSIQASKLMTLPSLPVKDTESQQSQDKGQSQDYSEMTSTTEQLSTRRSLNLPTKQSNTPQSREGRLLMNKSFRVRRGSKDQLPVLQEVPISINDCSPTQRMDYSTRVLSRKTQDESTSVSQHTGTLREILTARSKSRAKPDFGSRRVSVGPEALQERAMFKIAKKESSRVWDLQERQSLSRANPVEEAFPVNQHPLRTVLLNIPTNPNVQRALAPPSKGHQASHQQPAPGTSQDTHSPMQQLRRKRQALRPDHQPAHTTTSRGSNTLPTNKPAPRLFLPQMCLNRRDF